TRSKFLFQKFAAAAEQAKGFTPIPHLNVKAHQVLIGSFAKGSDLDHFSNISSCSFQNRLSIVAIERSRCEGGNPLSLWFRRERRDRRSNCEQGPETRKGS